MLIVSCQTKHELCQPLDAELAKTTVVDFLHAANYSEFEALRELTSDDFRVFGIDGEWNFDDLVQFIKDFPGPDPYNYAEFKYTVETDCNSALVTYRYGPTDGLTEGAQIDLHSVYLRLENGVLKIKLLHSTTMN